jgi:hypothetical protein
MRVKILIKLVIIITALQYISPYRTTPDFLKRPREIVKLLFVLDEHVEMIWDGLCKAGMRELRVMALSETTNRYRR